MLLSVLILSGNSHELFFGGGGECDQSFLQKKIFEVGVPVSQHVVYILFVDLAFHVQMKL